MAKQYPTTDSVINETGTKQYPTIECVVNETVATTTTFKAAWADDTNVVILTGAKAQ